MSTDRQQTVSPPEPLLRATRDWLAPVRAALGPRWLSSYLTGSVLTSGFDAKRSEINVLVIARDLDGDALDTLVHAIPRPTGAPRFSPLFLTRHQVERSLDVFPIEWLEISERHLLIEGEDVLASLEVPRTWLRHQCEHELRGKHLQLRQAWLASRLEAPALRAALTGLASSFHTLFRTLLRLQGETPPAGTERVIERVADVFQLDARALLGAYMVRYDVRRYTPEEIRGVYRAFLTEIERLVAAIDQLRVP